MDESVDIITPKFWYGSKGVLTNPGEAPIFGGGDTPQFPKEKEFVVAEPVAENAKDRRKRLQASMLTRDWAAPTLGQPALLGM
jgi:hypothetical protein